MAISYTPSTPPNVSQLSNSVGPAINVAGYGAQVEQGSQVYFVIDGQPIGYIQHLNMSETYGTQAFYGVGQLGPQDIQPMQFSGTVSVSGGRLYIGGWIGTLWESAEAVLKSGALSIAVESLVTNQADVVLYGCVVETYNATWANGVFTIQDATFLYKTSSV